MTARVNGATELVAPPGSGRTFRAKRRVGLGDVDPGGRCRLDAITAYQQDIATADYNDAGIGDAFAFVLRRNMVVVHQWPRVGERLDLMTWAGGIGPRWAERRTRMTGTDGAHVECAAVWVAIDGTGRPVPLPGGFVDVYGPATGGRTVTARLVLEDPSADPGGDMRSTPWALRRTDIDTLGHVNNAAQWQAVEEVLQAAAIPAALSAEIEHRTAIGPTADVRLVWAGPALWLVADGVIATAARFSVA